MLYPVSKGHQYGGDKNNTGTPQPAFSFVFDDSVEIMRGDGTLSCHSELSFEETMLNIEHCHLWVECVNRDFATLALHIFPLFYNVIKMQDVFIDIQSYFYHVTWVGL